MGAAILVVLIVLGVIFGASCGIWSAFRLKRISSEVEFLRRDLSRLERDLRRAPPPREATAPAVPQPALPITSEEPPPKPAPVYVEAPPAREEAIHSPQFVKPRQTVAYTEVAEREPDKPFGTPEWLTSLASFDQVLGMKALGWVGAFMFLVGMALFMKYAYDNNWIGPEGRLAIGVAVGCVALGLGERFRRNKWPVMFQALTGAGIALFYICVFFSFQVYHLSGATAAMGLAVLVTMFSVAMAVFHEAVAIAILGLIGGFLSPVLLSTGENHPYALFIYVAVLDLVALGAAYFRRWRALDLLCFAGTALLYYGWHERFYKPDQLTPAIIFNSLFYVMFLLIPTLHGIVKRLPERYESLALLAANAAYSLFWYYDLLFQSYRQTLGFVVIGQAALVLLLFVVYSSRLGKDAYTAQSLLILAMALVTIAVPIQLQFYGVPIVWAMEGVVFTLMGIRMQQMTGRIAGVAALFLAAAYLVDRLPLHLAEFLPVFNVPFGSWLVVIAGAAIVGFVLLRNAGRGTDEPYLYWPAFVLATVLACVLPSLEVWHYWRFVDIDHRGTYQTSSLIVLWTIIPVIVTLVIARIESVKCAPIALLAWIVGLVVFASGFHEYALESKLFLANAAFLPRLTFIVALWWMSRTWWLESPPKPTFRVVGHGLLLVLVALELDRWGQSGALISHRMSISLISAAWALQAFILVWMGLASRDQTLRIVGFAIYALAMGKVVLVDTSQLEEVYRIVSWMATGLFSLAAGYSYHRYSAMLLRESGGKPT